jgi:electron transfer flavoprotein beta subunit
VKILVTIKRVEDPEIKILLKPDGSGIVSDAMKYVINPFDDIAVEEALRIKAAQGGEVVVVCVGPTDASHQLRTALAMGADRGIHVLAAEGTSDPWVTSVALQKIVEQEKPDMVILGKQAVDDDMGQVGALLAERLGWGQATFASKETSLDSEDEKNKVPALQPSNGSVRVMREVDGGLETLEVTLPAVITTELRLNAPRYASLPGIMQAKRKEIKEMPLASLTEGHAVRVKILSMTTPSTRKAGIKVPDVATLVEKLRTEAKVL